MINRAMWQGVKGLGLTEVGGLVGASWCIWFCGAFSTFFLMVDSILFCMVISVYI